MDVKFILHDAGSRAIIALPKNSDIGQFLHSNILDTRLVSVSTNKWNQALMSLNEVDNDNQILNGRFCWINEEFVKTENANTSNNNIRRNKAKFLSRGYEYVNFNITRRTLGIASNGYFLTLDDLKMFPNIEDLAPQLCEAVGLILTDAIHQLKIEKESILNIYKHRKMAIWLHCKSLLSVDNEDDYEKWKKSVNVISGGIGLI